MGVAQVAVVAAATVVALWRYRSKKGAAPNFGKFVDSVINDSELDKVAFTSRWVAYERDLEHQRPDALFKDPFAATLGGETGKKFSEVMRGVLKEEEAILWAEWHVCWMAVRTRGLDDDIAHHFARHATQLVNVGAGLDTRAYRLQALLKASVFEVDLPQVIAAKENAMTAMDAQALCVARCGVSLDLLGQLDRLGPALRGCGFKSTQASYFLLEGLVMYFKAEEAMALLEALSALAAPGSRIAVGYIGVEDFGKGKKVAPAWACTAATIEALLTSYGWVEVYSARFGDPKFNFGRYPSDRAPDPIQSFCFGTWPGLT